MHLQRLIPLLVLPLLYSANVHGSPPSAAKVGEAAPEFSLKDLDGKTHTLSSFRGKTVVLEWFNPDCPFVVLAHGRTQSLKGEGNAKQKDGIVWLAINSNAKGKQGHGADANRKGVKRFGIQYPVLLDPTGQVGRLYGASRTPEMIIIDPSGTLRYRGAVDNSRGGDIEKDSKFIHYVRQSLKQLNDKKAVQPSKTKPWGCSVKY